MDIGALLHALVFDYTVRTVALGSAILGIVSGVLGAFAVLRKQSLLGDAVSHAALPGIALAFLLLGSKAALGLMGGAFIAGWLATLFMLLVIGRTRIKQDAALGISLAVFFGFGLLLLTYIQRRPDASQAGLDKYLFGQAATLVGRDVVAMLALGGIAILLVLALWKEFKLLTFDAEFAATLGYPTGTLEVLLISLMVVAIVVGLQTVGVVLMSAMLVAPAAAARQWTDRLGVMVALSGAFGALAGLLGALASASIARLPTGPTIVVCVSLIVGFSLLFAPGRGIIAGARLRRGQRWQFAQEALAVHLLQHEGGPREALENTADHMGAHMRWDAAFAQQVVQRAVSSGLVVSADGALQLTDAGRNSARRALTR